MLNHFDQVFTKLTLWWLLPFSIFIVALQILPGSTVVYDPFHHGEYFAAAIAFFEPSPQSMTPLMIHGIMDVIPAAIAKAIWGDGHYFLPTLLLYKAISISASILFIMIAYELTREKKHQGWLLLGLGVMVPLMVGYRDIFLLASIYIFTLMCNRNHSSSIGALLQVVFGSLVALGLLWSFDRGIAGSLSLGVATVILSFRNKQNLISLFVFLVIIILIDKVVPWFSIESYITNVRFLIETSSKWSYGWKYEPVTLTVFAIALNAVACLIYLRVNLTKVDADNKLGEILAFVLIAIFMLKIGTNRADMQHIYMSLWMPVLMVFRSVGGEFEFGKILKFTVNALFVIIAALAIVWRSFILILIVSTFIYIVYAYSKKFRKDFARVAFCILVSASLTFVLFSGAKGVRSGHYQWVSLMASPPDNATSSTPGVRWASAQLLRSNANCVFDLSNNGVINGLTNLPSCSRITYPVYAGKNHEKELIDAIRLQRPNAIIYLSTYWSYNIDGIKMRERFPALNDFLLIQYPSQNCAYGYCVRYLGDKNG